MGEKLKLYLNTSVPNALYDETKPDRCELTKAFWKKLKHYEVFISEITLEELRKTREIDPQREELLLELVAQFAILPLTQEAEKLASLYIKHAVIPEKHSNDALHLAIATVHHVNYLVSWNFRHLVNVRTNKQAQAVNSLYGYPAIQIIAPPELQ